MTTTSDEGRQVAGGPSQPVHMTNSASSPIYTDSGGFTPLGGHVSRADLSAAKTLTGTGPNAGEDRLLIQALTQNVRFTLDGTAPTAALGFQLRAGDPPTLIVLRGLTIKVIEEAATASLQYQWGKAG